MNQSPDNYRKVEQLVSNRITTTMSSLANEFLTNETKTDTNDFNSAGSELSKSSSTDPISANVFNPALVVVELFPDILQHYNSDQCRVMIEHLYRERNFVALNRAGPLGGYTALHWMCIKNEIYLMDYLITTCASDVNARATLAETPIFICVK